MDNVVFVSVAFESHSFGDQYLQQQERLKKSILAIYPDANLLFYKDEYPPGSKNFSASLYGFKPHAVQAAISFKFQHVIWCDTAMVLMDKIDPILTKPMLAVRDDNKLHNLISDRCLKYFGKTRKWVEESGLHLVGGSLYHFDFSYPIVADLFNLWKSSEEKGIFGSQYEEAHGYLQGHRADETCMAMCMDHFRMHPYSHQEAGYNCEQNPIFIKKHFK
jgi:hypothetical protein